MAHMLDMSNFRANIAYVKGKEVPWHRLGQELSEDSSIDTWVKEAGLNWTAEKSPVKFDVPGSKASPYIGKSVIYRSDTEAPLGIVSDDFRVVQPRDVVEFFKEAAGQANMKLEVAGSLFGGRRFWATARVDEEALKLNGVDEIRPYVLLITGCDGTLATNASLVATRVVCNNTAQIALSENGKRVRVTHASDFDPNLVKSQLGLIDNAWAKFKDRVTKMSKTKVDAKQATEFFIKLVSKKDDIEQSMTVRRNVDDLMNRFQNGIGAEMHNGTAWGLYSAVTEQTNYRGRAVIDQRMYSALFGQNANLVSQAESLISEMIV